MHTLGRSSGSWKTSKRKVSRENWAKVEEERKSTYQVQNQDEGDGADKQKDESECEKSKSIGTTGGS